MVTEAKLQPDYVPKEVSSGYNIKLFSSRFVYTSSLCRLSVNTELNASRGKWKDWFNTSSMYKPVVPGRSFADVVRKNSAREGPTNRKPLVNTQVVNKTGEPLELAKEGK